MYVLISSPTSLLSSPLPPVPVLANELRGRRSRWTRWHSALCRPSSSSRARRQRRSTSSRS